MIDYVDSCDFFIACQSRSVGLAGSDSVWLKFRAQFRSLALAFGVHRALSEQAHLLAVIATDSWGKICRAPRKPASPFRYFNSWPGIITLVVMMYVRFPLSLRNVECLLFERGIDLCHETVRHWSNRLVPMSACHPKIAEKLGC